MASLAAHLTASLLLYPVGVRRLLCSISLYLKNPSLYRSRIWYLSEPKWRNLDLYTLLVLLPIASLSHISIFLVLSENPTYRFSFLHQSLVVFIFWALLIFVVLRESFDLFSLPENLAFLFAGIAFLIEFHLTGRGIAGLGGWVYRILGGLAILCSACCVYLSIRPSAFFADFMLSSGLVLKGTWVLQAGLSLYTDAFGLKGCDKITGASVTKGGADVRCELDDDMWRGVVLMNLLFVGHVVFVFITGFVSFGALNRCTNTASGRLLAEIGSETMLMHPLPELEMD
ncbi:hypothetical protein ABFX02_07G051900 [Erythranthe guttata]